MSSSTGTLQFSSGKSIVSGEPPLRAFPALLKMLVLEMQGPGQG